MKKKIVILGLGGVLAIGGATTAILISNNVSNGVYLKASDPEYVLTIDSPIYEGNDPAGSGVDYKVVKTALGNDVKIEYSKLFEYEPGYHHAYETGVNCMKEDSYFAIVNNAQGWGVAGINYISITTDNDSYGDPKLTAYYGWDDGDYLLSEAKSTVDGDQTYTYTFSDNHPEYVKFVVTSGEASNRVGIHQIVVNYDCVRYSNPFVLDGDFGFYVYSDHATLSLYKGTNVDMVVPATVSGKPVTAIVDDFNLSNLPITQLESVTLPSTVTSIGDNAFKGASHLASINLDNVTYIGDYAFYYNQSLLAVDLSSVEYVGKYAFTYCDAMTDIGSLDSIETVQISAFQSTYALDISLSIPASATHFYDSAFSGSAITGLTIDDDAELIMEDAAFRNCDGLKDVYIGDNVITCDDFTYCDALETITVGANNTSYCAQDNVLYYTESASSWYAIRLAQKRPQTSYVMPENVVDMFPYSAYGSTTLQSVIFNNNITKIDDYVFNNCENLNSITFGTGLVTIGDSFANCNSLTSIHIPGNVEHVKQRAFINCEGLTTVIIDEGVKQLDKEAFAYCTALTTAVIPTTLTSAGDQSGWSVPTTDVFEGCTALTNVFTRLTSGSYATSVDGPIYDGFYGARTLNLYSETSATGCWHFDGLGNPVLW